MNFLSVNNDVEFLVSCIEKGAINVSPPYQRREVWSTKKGMREGLIQSIFNSFPIQQITLHRVDKDTNIKNVVDGKNVSLLCGIFVTTSSVSSSTKISTNTPTTVCPTQRNVFLTTFPLR